MNTVLCITTKDRAKLDEQRKGNQDDCTPLHPRCLFAEHSVQGCFNASIYDSTWLISAAANNFRRTSMNNSHVDDRPEMFLSYVTSREYAVATSCKCTFLELGDSRMN